MKIQEIINRLDRSENNLVYEPVTVEFLNEFNLNGRNCDFSKEKKNSRLRAYYLSYWYEHGEYLGEKIYFFDGEPVCLSSYKGRKGEECFEWFSTIAYKDVRQYLYQFHFANIKDINIISLGDEIPNTYKIYFISNLFAKHYDIPLFNNQKVNIIEVEENKLTGSKVKIQMGDGGSQWVDVSQLDFPINIY